MDRKQSLKANKLFVVKCIALAVLFVVEAYLGAKLLARTISTNIQYIQAPSESQTVRSPFNLPWDTVRIVFYVLLGVLLLLLISIIWDRIRIRKASAGGSVAAEPAMSTSFIPKTIELYPPEGDITKTLELEDEEQGQSFVLLQEIESEINCEIIT